MKYLYEINKNHDIWPELTIEADDYEFSNGFFHFVKIIPHQAHPRWVASVNAETVFNIARSENPNAE